MIVKLDNRIHFDGYKNKEEANKKKIIHDVFEKDDKYVNSGDLFEFDEDHFPFPFDHKRIDSIMVSMLTSCAIDRGFEHDRVKPKTIKLVFVDSPLSMQH
jgi:acyl-CoA synthetase (AMP-forming)/AMP-acid ligase II